MKKLFFILFFLSSFNTFSAGSKIDIPKYDWSWKGFFGTYDRASAQRGLKVYREVCAGCHSMNYLSYRNLSDLGFSEDHIKAIAAENLILDGPNDEGEMFERDGLPSDKFATGSFTIFCPALIFDELKNTVCPSAFISSSLTSSDFVKVIATFAFTELGFG